MLTRPISDLEGNFLNESYKMYVTSTYPPLKCMATQDLQKINNQCTSLRQNRSKSPNKQTLFLVSIPMLAFPCGCQVNLEVLADQLRAPIMMSNNRFSVVASFNSFKRCYILPICFNLPLAFRIGQRASGNCQEAYHIVRYLF